MAARLLALLRAPVLLAETRVVPEASVGIVLTDGSENAAELFRRADVAMYVAKRKGGGRFASDDGTAVPGAA